MRICSPLLTAKVYWSGFQWFFFIFCNTVVVPLTLLSAFHFPADNPLMLTIRFDHRVGLLVQVFCGPSPRHYGSGPTGLRWGRHSTITLGEASAARR
ncbi:hypothetical protein KCP69_22240 [Salmonella enterica subsp. enterica]|nr:hypothetical protein KCP69_22240 [Salmonella enterica subsp. enterica]